MNLLDELFISNTYSETYRSLGFPVIVHKSTSVSDKFNQMKVSLVPSAFPVYAVFAAEKYRDGDLSREDDREGETEQKAKFKFVRRDLVEAGIAKLETGDVLEAEICGEVTRWVITSFPDKTELPNIFVHPIATLMKDVNVSEVYG